MNYLGHYVYNHAICRLEPRPYFVLGVALPDLWTRFSRTRRIRWKAVCEATVSDPRATQLRDGLLNHVAVDRRFHALPSFVRWRRELNACFADEKPHSALLDFLAHLALELVLDHRVVRADPQVGEDIYDRIAACDLQVVEQKVSELGDVDARGLSREIQGFLSRRFLPRFARPDTLVRVADFVLSLTNARAAPSKSVIRELLDTAQGLVEPEIIWAEMRAGQSEAARPPLGLAAETPAKNSAI